MPSNIYYICDVGHTVVYVSFYTLLCLPIFYYKSCNLYIIGHVSKPSSGSFLRKTQEELRRIVEASNRTAARIRAAESLAKGPHFIKRRKL